VLNRYKQGDRVPITVRRFRRNMDFSVELAEPELFDYTIEEMPDATAAMKTLRSSWLSPN